MTKVRRPRIKKPRVHKAKAPHHHVKKKVKHVKHVHHVRTHG